MSDVPDPARQRPDPVSDPGAGDPPAEPGDGESVAGYVVLQVTIDA